MPPGGVSVARGVPDDRKRPAAGVNARPTVQGKGEAGRGRVPVARPDRAAYMRPLRMAGMFATKPGAGGNGNNGGVKTPPYARGLFYIVAIPRWGATGGFAAGVNARPTVQGKRGGGPGRGAGGKARPGRIHAAPTAIRFVHRNPGTGAAARPVRFVHRNPGTAAPN